MIAAPTIDRHDCGCNARPGTGPLMGLDDSLAMIAGRTRPVASPVTLPLSQATGRVPAAPVTARAMTPRFDNVAMEALPCAARTSGVPVPPSLPSGMVLRIFTGAPLPSGADAVVMQEAVRREGETAWLDHRPCLGQNIRRAGEDMAAGATILKAGQRLDARAIAACASAGQGEVSVRRALRVALLVTGDEVRQPDEALGIAGIRDVNTPMLRAALVRPDISLIKLARAPDERHGLARDLAALGKEVDLIVTTGGISVGEEDHVKPAFAMAGGEIAFSGVALKPGKPVSFGRIGGASWLGLPGNPVSAFVTWQVFGTAILDRLRGTGPRRRARRVMLETRISRKPGRCELRPACLGDRDDAGRDVVRCGRATHSARVATLAACDGLVRFPADLAEASSGTLLDFFPFDDT